MNTNQPKLILINRYFYPDYSATSQMLSDLAFGLAQDDTEKSIHIVTSRQRYDNASADLPPYEIINNVQVHRISTSRFGRQNLAGRAIDYFSFYISSFLMLLELTQPGDMLLAKTDPPLISLIAALVARIRRAYLINWLQDLFPEVAAQLGIKFARGLPYLALKAMRNKSLKQAKANIVIGELMAQRLRDEGIPSDKITVIHNWADQDHLHPVPHEENPLRKQWNLNGKFVVGYSGNLGRSHDFSTLLRVADELKERDDLVFLIVGGGAQLPAVQRRCQDQGLTNVQFRPYQPREKLAESLSAADVHLVSLKPELESLIVPSKFYGILAVGRPVIFIGANDGELARIITAHQCGDIVAQDDAIDLAQAIIRHAANAESLDYESRVRAVFDRQYAKVGAIGRFSKVLYGNG